MAIEAAHVYQGRGGEESAAHAGRSEKFHEFVVGQVVDGRVKRIMDYGVFVDLDGIDGLVPIREVSWDPVKNIREHCHEGDVVRVVVLSLDAAKQRISLSIRQLTERPKPVEREMASAVDKAELKARDAGDDEVRGDIYVRVSKEIEQRLPERVGQMVASHAGSFHGNGVDDPYEQVSSVLFEESVSRVYFVSNASTNVPRNCRERICPLGGAVENCALARSCCSVVILRPACDTPRMEDLFPGNEVLGIMASVQQCPHNDNGAVLAISGLTWMPKCGRRPFETKMSGRMIWSATLPFDRRPGNAFNAQMIERLSPISVITQRNLTTWQEYLKWRNALLTVKKTGIRYQARRFDAKNRAVVFTVIGPQPPNRFWLREDVYAVPLKNSVDQWQYREDSAEVAWKKRARPIALGELVSKKDVVRSDVDLAAFKAAKCPWNAPYIAEIAFSLDDDLVDEISSQFDDSAPEEEVSKYVESRFVLPEEGFLTVSSVGDESLIRRQQKALEHFAKEGSVAAPFLTSYLFDITKARVPETVATITDFLKKNLNESQKHAVSMMVSAPDIALIQGPPGTGKTTVIAEGIWQFVKQGKRVLLVSQSGAAVDNALDRLENIPAIRAVRLKKETAYSRNVNDGGRYAKDSVLENFYLTLAKSANEQLEYWRGAEEKIRMLSEVQLKLKNFLDRLTREERGMAQYRRAAESATRDLDQANRELSSRHASAVAARQVSEFVDYLNGADFPWALCGADVEVPQMIVSGFENFLLEELKAFSQLGVQLFVTPYNPEWPASQKMLSVKNSLGQLKVLQMDVLPSCAADIARLNRQVGDAVVSDSAALQIDDLQRKLEEVERLEDDETDDARLQELGRRRRELRKQINTLKRNSVFSIEQYRRVLNVPDAQGRNVVDWLANPERKRLELVEFLEGWHERIMRLVGGVEASVKSLVESLSSAKADVDIAEVERNVALCQRKVADAKEKLSEGERRCAPIRELLENEVRRLSHRVGTSFADGNAACDWCQVEIKRLQDGLAETASERKWREPLLKCWADRLSRVTDSDEDLVMSDYLKSCSVVGMTCTSDNSLLTNGGYDHFDVVIIDEVSKATPPELLMSMVLAEKAILVGDHRQLPPLFGDKEPKGLSEIMQEEEEAHVPEAQRITKESFSKYRGMVEASLFKQHFEQADDRLKSRLWYQYRMHPDIQKLVNLFYENRLDCGIDKPDEARNHLQSAERVPWMRHEGHAYWIDSSTDPDGDPFWEDSRPGSTSKKNPLEVALIFRALDDLDNSLDAYARTLPPDLGKEVKKTVGIISFYGLQVRALAKELKNHKFKRLKCRKPATVDRFQGQECDYILVSMTRHPARKQNLSHVAKFERINVAFSRARELLLIFGARDVFVDCDVWLPPLDRPGKPERKPVYRQMVDLLTREGRFLSSRELITRDQWKALAPTITRGEGGHEPAEGRRGQPRAGGYGAWGGGFKGHVRHHFHK